MGERFSDTAAVSAASSSYPCYQMASRCQSPKETPKMMSPGSEGDVHLGLFSLQHGGIDKG